MILRICKKCIMPNTKPDLEFNKDGVCQGCSGYLNRKKIDWEKRRKEFIKIINRYKNKIKNNYDCIIPVSGGKDSFYQVLKALEYDLNPLCVTSIPDKLTDLGRHNLDGIKKLGVDHIEISTNPKIRRKINKFTLKTIGDISWAEHMAIWTTPIKISTQLKIPLIIWGENSQNENGGPEERENVSELDTNWLYEFGGISGLRTSDLLEVLKLNTSDIIQFTYPTSKELRASKTFGIFLGYFFPWDGHENANTAIKNGLKVYRESVEGSIVNYENLDNAQMRVHDYFKFLKYGYDRVTDWCCWHIRRGRMLRKDALIINKKKSGSFPSKYLGVKLEEVLKEINCSKKEFINICEDFTNKEIFKCNNNNDLIKRPDGSLILKEDFQ